MLGNVWEWCDDPPSPPTPNRRPRDKRGIVERVIRGGGWNGAARQVRSASRYQVGSSDRDRNLGFRCCVTERFISIAADAS